VKLVLAHKYEVNSDEKAQSILEGTRLYMQTAQVIVNNSGCFSRYSSQ